MGGEANSREQTHLEWLGLRLIPGVGSVRFARLVGAMGSPGAVLGAGRDRLEALPGIGPELASAISRKDFSRDPEEELSRLYKMKAKVVTLHDADYPPLLAQVYAPPPVLFYRGDLTPCLPGGVAVVGSRKVSPYGKRVAFQLGRDLAAAGMSVVSGLARGTDASAHRGALDAGGHTVGVLGCGLDVDYPPDNVKLMAEMAEKGAVLSEFPLGTPPSAANFPIRNRVISGLSRAVVVVEGSIRSGSLITARHALDQGREILAVPGPVGTPGVEGTHELIRQGARLLESARDILEPGGLPRPQETAQGGPEAGETARELPLDAARLLEHLGPEPVHADVLVRETGLMAQEVNALLVTLEMADLVEGLPGRNYVLKNQL